MSSIRDCFCNLAQGAIAMPFDCFRNNYNEIGVGCFGNQWVALQGVNLAIATRGGGGGLITPGSGLQKKPKAMVEELF